MAQLNFDMKIIPELDVAKLNAALKAMKAAMGDLGKGITLIDEGALRKEYALIDAAVKKVTDSTRQMASGTNAAGKEATELERTLTKAADKGSLLGKAFAFNQIAQGLQTVTAAFTPYLNAFMDFDKGMADFSAITGVTGEALDAFGLKARELAKEFGSGVIEQIDAFKGVLSRLGPDIAKSPEALEAMSRAVNTLSKASGLDAAASMDALTSAVLQFNVNLDDPIAASAEMTRMMNVMAAGAKEGAAEVPQITEAIVQAGVAASGANLSFEETNAAIQVLAAGGKYGAEAGTALRNVLGYLQKATGPAAETLKSMGTSTQELGKILTEEGLAAAIKRLRTGFDGIGSDSERNAALIRIFGKENSASAGIMLKNADSITELTGKLTGTSTAFEQAGINMDTAASASDRFQAKIEDLAIGAFQMLGGQVATVGSILTQNSAALTAFGALTPVFGGMASAAGSFAKSLLTKYVPSVITTDAVTKTTTVSMKALSVAFMTNPFVLAIAGAVALGVALYALSNALTVTAAEQLEEKQAELELNKAQEETLIKRKKLAESNIGLIDEYSKLKSATKGTVEDTEQYGNMLLKLSMRYPGVIDSSKSYEENLAALKIKSAEATEELAEMEKQMEALQKGTARLEYEVAVSEVNVKAEEIEDAARDALGLDFWDKVVAGIPGMGVVELITGDTEFNKEAALKSVKESSDAIKKAWTDAEIGKAVVKAQTDFINDPRYKNLSGEEKKIIFDKIAEEGELQRIAAKAKNENRYMEEKLDLSKRVQLYIDNAEEIAKIEVKQKSGTATPEDLALLDELKKKQLQISTEIQDSFNKLRTKGVDVTAVINTISKNYGISKEKVAEIVGVQGSLNALAEETAESVMSMAAAYKSVGDAISGAFTQAKDELTFAKQIKALKQADYEDRLQRLRDSGNEEDRQAANAMEKARNMTATEVAALKKKTDAEFNVYKTQKEQEKIVNEMYSLEKKKGGGAASLLQTLEKEYDTRKKAIDNELEMTEITVELARLQSGREKSVYDEITFQERKLQSIEAQKKAFEDIYKITKSETGEITVGVSLKEDEKAKITEDYNSLVNQIGSESNKTLEITLKAKADFDKTALEIAEGVAALNLERLRYEIEIGIQAPEVVLPILEGNLDALREQLAAKEAAKAELQLKIDMAADPKERLQLEADLQKISKEITDISKKELDATKELSSEQKKVSDVRISQLQREHDEEMSNIQARIEEEKRLNQVRMAVASRIADAANEARKQAELTALDKKFGKYQEETDAEKQYREEKERIEIEYNNRAKSVADAARGAELEAERQQTLLLLNEKKKRATSLLEEAKKAGDTAKIKDLEEQLSGLDKSISSQSDMIIAHSAELKDSVSAIFGSVLGEEESLKAPWRQLLSVVAGGLKQYLSLLATQLVFGEVSKYSSTGLVALLLIPAFQGIVNAALNAILDPILSGVASFSTGGRVDSPTFAIVGDASSARPGADTEWIFRDDQLKAMMEDIVQKNLSGVADMFRQLANFQAANFDIARLGVDNAAVLTRTLIEQGIGRDVTIEKLHEKETTMIKEVLAKGTEAEKQYLSLSKGNVMLQELGSISITNIFNKNLMYGAIEELPVNDGIKQLLQRSMPGNSNAEIVMLLESLNSKVKQLDALNQQSVKITAALDRQNELAENLNRLPEQLEALKNVNKSIESLPATVQITQNDVGTAANRYNRSVNRRVRT